MSANLKEISTFIKKNNSYSDYNLVNNFLSNLNFTKLNSNNNLIGGTEPFVESNNSEQNKQTVDTFVQQVSNTPQIQDIYLQNPPYTTEQANTYTIKSGTILYHATTNKKGFNTNQLNLGQDKLINFFTPNFRLASDKIEGCSVDKQNGFIHVFRVIKDIPNIYIKLPYDIANDINAGALASEFCSGNQNYYGIGFFYPKNNIEMFSNDLYQNQHQNKIQSNPEQYYSEFGLCNPKPYLKYLYSQKCQSLRKLSVPYRFD